MSDGFSELIDEVRQRPLDVAGRWLAPKRGGRFIQYGLRYRDNLHYEILDGSGGAGLMDEEGKPLYEKGVAYVELHFEEDGDNSLMEQRRIEFFKAHLAPMGKPFHFIPQWGYGGIGFALRYLVDKDHLGGVPCPAGADMKMVRNKIEPNLCSFIKELDPVLNQLEKAFLERENAMNAVTEYAAKLERAKQIIFTGAPGTGKTFLAQRIAREIVLSDEEKKLPESDVLAEGRITFVQFHPSYDYTDFVEGLRPIQGADGQVGFKRQDGAFKALCRAAVAAEKYGEVDNFEEVWSRFISDLDERHSSDNPLELATAGKKESTFRIYLNSNKNLSFITSGTDKEQGSLTKANLRKYYVSAPEGDSWKCYFNGVLSYLEDAKNGYGLKPYVAGKNIDAEARPKFVMIIDEINRGDISKIFGELFYAIDDGYRGEKGRVKTQYQNLVEKDDAFYDGFFVPENVYIIGTMNDVDRNVESMDFAIRRRFTWLEITPEERFGAMMADISEDVLSSELKEEAKIRMTNLNREISNKDNELGPAYQIGPSYFRKLKDYVQESNSPFADLWKNHLEPLIREYYRGIPNADEYVAKIKNAFKDARNHKVPEAGVDKDMSNVVDADGGAATGLARR